MGAAIIFFLGTVLSVLHAIRLLWVWVCFLRLRAAFHEEAIFFRFFLAQFFRFFFREFFQMAYKDIPYMSAYGPVRHRGKLASADWF